MGIEYILMLKPRTPSHCQTPQSQGALALCITWSSTAHFPAEFTVVENPSRSSCPQRAAAQGRVGTGRWGRNTLGDLEGSDCDSIFSFSSLSPLCFCVFTFPQRWMASSMDAVYQPLCMWECPNIFSAKLSLESTETENLIWYFWKDWFTTWRTNLGDRRSRIQGRALSDHCSLLALRIGNGHWFCLQ